MTIKYSINGSTSYLRDEYERQQALFDAQPVIVRHFLEAQALRLANALINSSGQVHYSLPDRVVDKTPQTGAMAAMLVPDEMREQVVGSWHLRINRTPLRDALRESFSQLEQSPDQAISTSATLLRFSTAMCMVHTILPSGRAVKYRTNFDEQIPTIPEQPADQLDSALSGPTDAIYGQDEGGKPRGELISPFVPAARRFYLPQWVSFDDECHLLVNSLAEAEASLLSMQRFVAVLHGASSLAPYIVADEEYQRKRYGMLGQVINQGRALARYKTGQIIQSIRDRVANGTLNRGLSIKLPYYNDQDLNMAEIELEVVPAGRISFKPVFMVRAVHLESAKVSQDTRLNSSTRKYLLQGLEMLEKVFANYSPIQSVR